LIFVSLQVVWFLFLSLWIVWYIQNKLRIEALARQLALRDVSGGWLILVGGSLLMLLILLGINFLFVSQVREARFNRLQADFISSITHELKSPLASIQLYLETINLRDPPPEVAREFIGHMLMETERLSHLIDNILVASRIRRGRLSLDPTPVDIYQFIQDFFNQVMLRYGWDRDAITLSGKTGLIVMVDKQYMEMVLINIVTNAIKYSNRNFRLFIKIEADQDHVNLNFIDQGMGVEPKELKKVFKVFYRSPTIREIGVQGTGLGLFIVRDVIRALGGRVTASSEGFGQGLTITLSLPQVTKSGKKKDE